MARRSFTTEFKHEAACLVVDQKYTVRQASEAVGVAENEIRRWVKQLRLELSGGTPEQQEIQKLKTQVAPLEREKEILKKATALLMSDTHNQFR